MFRLTSLVVLALVLVFCLLVAHVPSVRCEVEQSASVGDLAVLPLSSPVRRILSQVHHGHKSKPAPPSHSADTQTDTRTPVDQQQEAVGEGTEAATQQLDREQEESPTDPAAGVDGGGAVRDEKDITAQQNQPSRRRTTDGSSDRRKGVPDTTRAGVGQANQASKPPTQPASFGGARGAARGQRGAAQQQPQRKRQADGSQATTIQSEVTSAKADTTETADTADATVVNSVEQQQSEPKGSREGGGAVREAEAAEGDEQTEADARPHQQLDAPTVAQEEDKDTAVDNESEAQKAEAGGDNERQTADRADSVCPPSSVTLTAHTPSETDEGVAEEEGSLVVSISGASPTADCVAPSSYLVHYSAFPHFPVYLTASQRVDAGTTSLTLPSADITPGVRYYVRIIASSADPDNEDTGPAAESEQQQPTLSEPLSLALPPPSEVDKDADTTAISMCEAVVRTSMAHSKAAHTSLSLRTLRTQLTTLLHIKPMAGDQERIKAFDVAHNAETERDEVTVTISAPHAHELNAATVDEQKAEAALTALQSDDKSALYTQPAWLLAEMLKFKIGQLGARGHTTAQHIGRVEAVRLNCTPGSTGDSHSRAQQARSPDESVEPAPSTEQATVRDASVVTAVDNTAAEVLEPTAQPQDKPADAPMATTEDTADNTDEETEKTQAIEADTAQKAAAETDDDTDKATKMDTATEMDTVTEAEADTAVHTDTETNPVAGAAEEATQQQSAHAQSDKSPVGPADTQTPENANTDVGAHTAADDRPHSEAATQAAGADSNTPVQQQSENRANKKDDNEQQEDADPAQRDTRAEAADAAEEAEAVDRPVDEAEPGQGDGGGQAADTQADRGLDDSQLEGRDGEQEPMVGDADSSSTPEDQAAMRESNRSTTLLGFLFSHTLVAALLLAACMGSIAYCVLVRSADNRGFAPLRQSDTDLERGKTGGPHSATSHSSLNQHTAHSSSASANSASVSSLSSAASSDRSMVELDDEQQYQLALLRHSDTANNGGLHFLEDVLTRLGIPSYGQAAFSQKLRDHYLTTIQQIEALDAADWRRINLPLVIEEAVRRALADRAALIAAGGEASIANSVANRSKVAGGLSLKHGAAPHKKHDREREANGASSKDGDAERPKEERRAVKPNGSGEKRKKPLVSEAIDDEHEEDMEGWADDF